MRAGVVFGLIVGLGACGTEAEGPQVGPGVEDLGRVTSDFERCTEGWTLLSTEGDVRPRWNDGVAETPAASIATDWVWTAPGAFVGDKATFEGGRFAFSFRSGADTRPGVADAVVLVGAGHELSITFADSEGALETDAEWITLYTTLEPDAGWTTAAGEPVDADVFSAVLADLEALELHLSSDLGQPLAVDEVTLQDARYRKSRPLTGFY